MNSVVDSSEVPLFGEQHIPVYLNVYDMLPRGKITDIGYRIGVGVFHSGVEILGREYNFGGHDYDFTGVFVMRPKIGPPNVTFKESIAMGYTTLDKEEIKNVIDELSAEWRGNSYNLLTRNCNHFSSELCSRLVGKAAPNWINRAAKLGTFFPCIHSNSWIMSTMDKYFASEVHVPTTATSMTIVEVQKNVKY
ncbi:5569_t:CDS:2 [Funneliformis geosporum]|uniref:18517_t:CDS:1 n=1 Tax=Funneliformis geosporum TaxID=1117311 RepID=A0A9W4SMN1_9GLOM|nr:18517_t:CDS:2 [Funneliformis geosporum]CAI2183888.1 5569_t:CDS:2 [Funneliformis geosporum]